MAFTSIKGAAGWPVDAVVAAYDKAFGWALKASGVAYTLIDKEPEEPTSHGSSIKLQLNNYYTEADVVAAQTPLDEETDVTPTRAPQTSSVTLTPQEFGFAEQHTIYMGNRSLTPFDPVAARLVGEHCRDTLDYYTQTQARLGTQVFRAAGRASTATVAAGDLQKSTEIRKAVTTLNSNSAQPRDGQFFVGLIHPKVVHDLREETGSGGWRVPQEYGSSQMKLYNGEFGEWEGVRWIVNNRVKRATDNDGAAGINVYRTLIMGREALAKAVVSEPNTVLSPQTDRLRRWVGLGWKADLAVKIYRDQAIVRLEAASSLG